MSLPRETSSAPADKIGLGIAWMVVTTFFFVCVHTLGKYLVQDYPVWQVVWARFFFHLVIAAAILGPRVKTAFNSQRIGLQFTRSGFMLGASLLYFMGVQTVPMAEANAIMFLCPVLVVVLAPWLLKEQVGLRRWLGVLAGFAGAFLIIRPSSDLWQIGAVILLGSAFFNALYHITTRKIRGSDDPTLTLFFTPMAGVLFGFAALPFVWQSPDAVGWGLFFLIGLVATVGHLALIKAYHWASAPVAAPFAYLNLVWTVIAVCGMRRTSSA